MNSRDDRKGGNTSRKRVINCRDANKSRDDRNVGNTRSRRTATVAGTAATAEALVKGLQECQQQ